MPIPPTNRILNILPPHIGDPREESDISPYPCTIEDVCTRYKTSPKRTELLNGLISFRLELLARGIKGYQWIDGSFVEDIETQERRDPNDVDVVTFVTEPTSRDDFAKIFQANQNLFCPVKTKVSYCVEHFFIPPYTAGIALVNLVNYYGCLFGHRRDGVWKGFLRVDLSDEKSEEAALKVLELTP